MDTILGIDRHEFLDSPCSTTLKLAILAIRALERSNIYKWCKLQSLKRRNKQSECATEMVHSTMQTIAKQNNVLLRREMPHVFELNASDDLEAYSGCFNNVTNSIVLGSSVIESVHNTRVMCRYSWRILYEEIGHAIHAQYEPVPFQTYCLRGEEARRNARISQEFFGFVIGMMFRLQHGCTYVVREPHEDLHSFLSRETPIPSTFGSTKVYEVFDDVHRRGYEMATRIDVRCITNWPKFLSLTPNDVLERFDREEPDYSGL